MTDQIPAELRAVVAQVVREVVADVARDHAPRPAVPAPSWSSGASASAAAPPTAGHDRALRPSGPLQALGRSRTETVRITGNADLQSFAYRLLDLFENPKNREDLRAGRLAFELAGGVAAAAAPGAVERIEQGAVTERRIAAAASAGTRLVLGRRAVLTPLAREKARSLGVPVEKER
jgi:hypothetical protein